MFMRYWDLKTDFCYDMLTLEAPAEEACGRAERKIFEGTLR